MVIFCKKNFHCQCCSAVLNKPKNIVIKQSANGISCSDCMIESEGNDSDRPIVFVILWWDTVWFIVLQRLYNEYVWIGWGKLVRNKSIMLLLICLKDILKVWKFWFNSVLHKLTFYSEPTIHSQYILKTTTQTICVL